RRVGRGVGDRLRLGLEVGIVHGSSSLGRTAVPPVPAGCRDVVMRGLQGEAGRGPTGPRDGGRRRTDRPCAVPARDIGRRTTGEPTRPPRGYHGRDHAPPWRGEGASGPTVDPSPRRRP